jgi:hypothetical protein
MSGMDPHMIRWNLRWVWFGWFIEVDFIRLWVGHGVTPRCDQSKNLEELL